MKPYACCRGLHAGIDALLQILAETQSDSRSIARILVHGNAQFRLQFDRLEPDKPARCRSSACSTPSAWRPSAGGRRSISSTRRGTGDPEVGG